MTPASSMKALTELRPKTLIDVQPLPLPNMMYRDRMWQEVDTSRFLAVAEKNVWDSYVQMVSNRRSAPAVYTKQVHQYNDNVNGLICLYEEFLPEEQYAELRGD